MLLEQGQDMNEQSTETAHADRDTIRLTSPEEARQTPGQDAPPYKTAST